MASYGEVADELLDKVKHMILAGYHDSEIHAVLVEALKDADYDGYLEGQAEGETLDD